MNKLLNGMKHKGILKKSLILVLVMTLLMSMAACNGAKQNNTNASAASFYYEESKLGNSFVGTVPTDSFRITSKNKIVTYDRSEDRTATYRLFDSDGNPIGEIKAGFSGEGGVFTLDNQDNLYAIENIANGSQVNNILHVYSSEGKSLKTIELGENPVSEGKGTFSGYADIAVDSKGNIYLANPGDKMEVLDKDGNELKAIDREGCIRLAVGADDSLFVATQAQDRSSQIEKIDTSGNSVWKFDLDMKSGNYRGFLINPSDNCLYMLRDDGVEKVGADGEPVGMAIAFSDYEIKNTGFSIFGMSMDKDNNIYILTISDGGSSKSGGSKPSSFEYQLYRYTYKEGVRPASNKTEITVLARRPGGYLDVAAGIFNQANPEFKIKIETVPEGEQRDQFISQINTDIMAGKGPDILMAGWWMPYENYISKGIFVDIAQLMAQDKSFDPSQYDTAIFDGMKRNGQMPLLPVSFTFNAMMANQTVLDEIGVTIDDNTWTWDDFKAVSERVVLKDSQGNPTRTALPNVGPSDLLDYFLIFGNQIDQFVDRPNKKTAFDSKEFQDMLELIKSFANNNLTSIGMKQGMEDVIDAAARGSIVFKPDTIQDYGGLAVSKAMFGGNEASALNFPHETGDDAGVFSSTQIYAINKASKYQDKAWEFLKILLSEDVQMSDLTDFPVNNEARNTLAQKTVQDSAGGEGEVRIGEKSLKVQPVTQADIGRINEMISKLERVSLTDDQIYAIIHEETSAFFSGDKTAAEVAGLIQNRVNTYLNE